MSDNGEDGTSNGLARQSSNGSVKSGALDMYMAPATSAGGAARPASASGEKHVRLSVQVDDDRAGSGRSRSQSSPMSMRHRRSPGSAGRVRTASNATAGAAAAARPHTLDGTTSTPKADDLSGLSEFLLLDTARSTGSTGSSFSHRLRPMQELRPSGAAASRLVVNDKVIERFWLSPLAVKPVSPSTGAERRRRKTESGAQTRSGRSQQQQRRTKSSSPARPRRAASTVGDANATPRPHTLGTGTATASRSSGLGASASRAGITPAERMLRIQNRAAMESRRTLVILEKTQARKKDAKAKLTEERERQRLQALRLRTKQRSDWKKRMDKSPFLVDLLAETERIEEENQVRQQEEARRKRLIEQRKAQIKNDIIIQALEESAQQEQRRVEKVQAARQRHVDLRKLGLNRGDTPATPSTRTA